MKMPFTLATRNRSSISRRRPSQASQASQASQGRSSVGNSRAIAPSSKFVEALEERRLLSTTVLSEDFDGVIAPLLPAGWNTNNTGGSPWVTDSSTSFSAPNSAFGTANNTGVADEKLKSPVIAITGDNADLRFKNNYDLQDVGSGYDGAVLEIKIGAGGFQDILAAGGSFVTGGYNGVIDTSNGSPIAGRAAWTGTSGGFINTRVNLPAAAAGQNIELRWRVATDSSIASVGQWIDNVRVIDDTAPVAVDDGPVNVVPSTPTVVYVLANDSDADLGDVLAITNIAVPLHGTAVLQDNSTPSDTSDDYILYTPDTGYHGPDTFTYTITDGHAAYDTATVTINVGTGVGVGPDPCGGGDALDIVGTSGNDTILVSGTGITGEALVFINGVQQGGTWTGIDSVLAFGLGGNDTITVSNFNVPSMLFGDGGDDSLNAGGGANVLVGGPGNDQLNSGGSNDLLIGGTAADKLSAGGGNDILVAGTTSYDTNIPALCAIREGTLNLTFATVFSDSSVDDLNGAGGNDIYVGNFTGGGIKDKLKQTKGDIIVDL